VIDSFYLVYVVSSGSPCTFLCVVPSVVAAVVALHTRLTAGATRLISLDLRAILRPYCPNILLTGCCDCVTALRLQGRHGATLGAIGAQLPYPYVHLVYWTIQIVLVALSIETGVILAANTYFKDNGRYMC
jgi:hypothetical protein